MHMGSLAWPWVSRRALDAVADERDRLRVRVDHLSDELVQLARHSHGLSARKPEPRARREIKPLPTELRNLISGFANPIVQQQMEHEIRNRLRAGAKPDDLTHYVRSQLGVDELEA